MKTEKRSTLATSEQPHVYGIRPFLDTGPLAPEVAAMVVDVAFETLAHWMEHIGAPDEATNLLNAMKIYGNYEGKQRNGGQVPASTMEIEYLPIALNAVAIMGGDWTVSGSVTKARPMPGLKPIF